MSLFHNKTQITDPGFGTRFGGRVARSINKDGSFNVRKSGVDGGVRAIYQELLGLSTARFFLLVLLGYILINVLFALLYFVIGPENLIGVRGETPVEHFLDCFYFSTQTFTTVGYGSIAPRGILASSVASFEALLGLLSFAIATGLLYARFSKPTANLLYSKNALVSPYLEGEALMFRFTNRRTNVLMQMTAKVILVMPDDANNLNDRKYYNLKVEIDQLLFLALSWTIVHKIDENSPLVGLEHDELLKRNAEIIILITGFDDTFNEVVHSRYSYLASEFIFGAKFRKAFQAGDGGTVEMNINDIHLYDEVPRNPLKR